MPTRQTWRSALRGSCLPCRDWRQVIPGQSPVAIVRDCGWAGLWAGGLGTLRTVPGGDTIGGWVLCLRQIDVTACGFLRLVTGDVAIAVETRFVDHAESGLFCGLMAQRIEPAAAPLGMGFQMAAVSGL